MRMGKGSVAELLCSLSKLVLPKEQKEEKGGHRGECVCVFKQEKK